ncbi:hypothetical protein ACFPN2_28030 [Steroidobacter flavus]|uniref:Uncharacterized protein n=1 Tax=Steroidobacter flavus TaxID=1842136 RepID=A0ABV8T0K4_9GAMM
MKLAGIGLLAQSLTVLLGIITTTLFGADFPRAPNTPPATPHPSLSQMATALRPATATASDCAQGVQARLEINQGHPWLPPFGIDRVGRLPIVQVTIEGDTAQGSEYYFVAFRNGRAHDKQSLHPAPNHYSSSPSASSETAKLYASASLANIPDEVALFTACVSHGQAVELARIHVDWPVFEADTVARSKQPRNPIDLGAVLVPNDWLLLGPEQEAIITTAAIARGRDIPNAMLHAWFENGSRTSAPLPLTSNVLTRKQVELPSRTSTASTTLFVSISDGSRELWRKTIRTTNVARSQNWPVFGAVETKLRYEAPISMHDPHTGARLPSIDYQTAWKAGLNDVVVFLPNGSRFVFWRGSSYVPFWAGPNNTGVSYQWAENMSIRVHHPDGSTDLPEPLFDRELRYGRVRIIESTASRVHVRWTYQLTDVDYRVWGDQAAEDFYFYPDGFGTRVITLSSTPGTPYQLTEFIVLSPQGAFPLDVLPNHIMDALFLSGEKQQITLPTGAADSPPPGRQRELVANAKRQGIVYRLFSHKNDLTSAIYYSPGDLSTPGAYWPFFDEGQMVAPTYWGNHWPLSRGHWTQWTINDGIYSGPSHNSVASWLAMPDPVARSEYRALDALGESKLMTLQRWVALVGNTDAPDRDLIGWAKSFSAPPSLTLSGARLGFPSYSPERRAIRLLVDSASVDIRLKPVEIATNPVFELENSPGELIEIRVDDRLLKPDEYAWDGSTLWTRATIHSAGARIHLHFKE